MRPPRRVLSTALCFTAIVVALGYAAQARWVDTAVLLLAGLGQVLCFLALRTDGARALGSLILLVAGVSAAELLYERIPLWDLLIHLLATGVLTAMLRGLHHTWVRSRTAPAAGAPPRRLAPRDLSDAPTTHRVLVCAAVGLGLAVVWELLEVAGYHLVTPEIHNPPLDTVLDIAAGVIGSAVVGLRRAPL